MATPGWAGSQRRRVVGPELLQDIPEDPGRVFEICAILESKSRRPPRKISASSWHARSSQKLVTPIWLRQQQDFSTPHHDTMPSPFQVCKVTLSPLFGFLWAVLCPSHLPCSARPGTGRPAPGPLGLGPIRGVTLGPGPVTLPFGPSHGQGPLHHLPSGPSHGQGPVDHLSGHSAMTFAEPSDAAL